MDVYGLYFPHKYRIIIEIVMTVGKREVGCAGKPLQKCDFVQLEKYQSLTTRYLGNDEIKLFCKLT